MSTYIKLVQGDTKPDIIVALNDRMDGSYINVSDANASVVMKFRKRGTTAVLQEMEGTKLTGGLQADGTIDTTITTPGAGGRVSFTWQPGALDVDPGYYEGEITVTYANGSVQTLHDIVKFSLRADF